MANIAKTVCCCLVILCAAYVTCSTIQSIPNRPQNKPYWWLGSAPWKKMGSANLELSTEATRQEGCDDVYDENCQVVQHEVESANNEISANFEASNLHLEETTPPITTTTTTTTFSSTLTRKQSNVFSATDLDELDESEEDDTDNMYCGIDARHITFDWKNPDRSPMATDFAEYPWVLYVYHKEDGVATSLCAATLLESNIAITAAHCVKKYRNKHVIVRAGEWDLESEFGEDEAIEHQDRRVKNIIIHQNFTESRTLNDIAILHLDRPFLKKNNIGNVCLPTKDDTYGSTCIAAGWGNTGSLINPLDQRYMRQSQLSIFARKDCQSEFRQSGKGPRFRLRSTQICARNVEGGGTCVGGCGGGLFCQTTEKPYRFVLVGLGSWGKCSDKQLGVFTNVYKFKEWIMDTMDDIKEMV